VLFCCWGIGAMDPEKPAQLGKEEELKLFEERTEQSKQM
jgi:hypothetical protein